jgi:hypothetical protein
MTVHPNPISMAAHVERRRRELFDQAQREQVAKEAIAGAALTRHGQWEVGSVVAGRARKLFSRLRPGLTQPLELAQSSPGDVL